MEHTLLVAAHAGSGVVAFVAGCALLARRTPGPLAAVLVAATASTASTLVALVALDWPRLQPAQRLTFTALAVLAAVLVARAVLALLEARRRRDGWRLRLLPHAGFVVVALLDALCVVSAVDLHLPALVVAVVAALAAAPGVLLVRRAVRREQGVAVSG